MNKTDSFDEFLDEVDYDYSINEHYIRNDEEFEELLLKPYLDEGRRIFYRGESIVSMKRPLLPTMYRQRSNFLKEDEEFTDIDAGRLFEHYREKGDYLNLYNSVFGSAEKEHMYDLCAFSQHYLNDSPLIDFSKSLYAALSFGLKGRHSFEDDALLYTIEIYDPNKYTDRKETADVWLNGYHVRICRNSDHSLRSSSPDAMIIDIATNDLMKYQQGVFLLLDDFDLVNRFYLTKNVRSSVSFGKFILDKEYCPRIEERIEAEAPWYVFDRLLNISSGLKEAIDHKK